MKPTKEEIKKRIVADTRDYELCVNTPVPPILKEIFPEYIGEDGRLRVPFAKGDSDGSRYFSELMADPEIEGDFWEKYYPYVGYEWGSPLPAPSFKDSNIPESMPIHLKKNLLAILVCDVATDCFVTVPVTALIKRPDLQELFREYIRNDGMAYIPFHKDNADERHELLKSIIKGEYPEYSGHYCYLDKYSHLYDEN